VEERLASLTKQERDLLELMMAGHGIPEVAQLRTVAEATVRAQSRSMFKKLKVSSQLQAVAAARAHGWTPKQV
jgi:DNA-binding NarL/FixJ family response regulator